MAIKGGLYKAVVFHKRLRPVVNSFTYQVFYLAFPLSQLASLSLPVLSLERFNLFGFYNKDHGPRDGSALEPWIRGILARFGVTTADGEVVLVAYPRVMGYVFNPVSFWFCLDKSGAVRAVLAEVNNTFGERHSYLISHPDQRPIVAGDELSSDKQFHVSPFMHVKGRYRFRFSYSPDKIGVVIDYDTEEGEMLKTSLVGKRFDLNNRSMLLAFASLPLVTFKTVALIHWQALKLWLRGVRYVPKPKPPSTDITRGL